MRPLPFRLYVISDRTRMDANPADAVAALARAGLSAFQWREKDLGAGDGLLWLSRLTVAIEAARGDPSPQSLRAATARSSDSASAPQYPWQFAGPTGPAPRAPAELPVIHAWQRAPEQVADPAGDGHVHDSGRPAAFHLFVNDRTDLALLAACHLHLAENSVPTLAARSLLPASRLIARSTHSLEGALAGEREGADFITFGPVFDTPSKRAFGPPLGLPVLRELCHSVTIPVLALGGVTLERIEECRQAGAWGVAMMGAIWDAADRVEALAKARALSGDDGVA